MTEYRRNDPQAVEARERFGRALGWAAAHVRAVEALERRALSMAAQGERFTVRGLIRSEAAQGGASVPASMAPGLALVLLARNREIEPFLVLGRSAMNDPDVWEAVGDGTE